MRLPKDRLEALNLLEQIRKSILQSAEILIHPQPDWERRHLTPIGKPQTPAHSGKAAIHSKITLENLQVGGNIIANKIIVEELKHCRKRINQRCGEIGEKKGKIYFGFEDDTVENPNE